MAKKTTKSSRLDCFPLGFHSAILAATTLDKEKWRLNLRHTGSGTQTGSGIVLPGWQWNKWNNFSKEEHADGEEKEGAEGAEREW